MSNNVTLIGGSVVETIDEGGGVERQVLAIGSIGKAGSETQLVAGQATAANSIPAVLASDLAGVGSRNFVVKGTINNGQSTYTVPSNPVCVGGLITVATGLPANTVLTGVTLRIKCLQSNLTSLPTTQIKFFDANPSSSTFTDNTAQSLNSADLAKLILVSNVNGSSTDTGGWASYTLNGPRLKVDGSGNFYFAFIALNPITFGATNCLVYEADGSG